MDGIRKDTVERYGIFLWVILTVLINGLNPDENLVEFVYTLVSDLDIISSNQRHHPSDVYKESKG